MSALAGRIFISMALSCPATIRWRDVRGLFVSMSDEIRDGGRVGE